MIHHYYIASLKVFLLIGNLVLSQHVIAIKANSEPLQCTYAPGLTVGGRQRELQCCQQTYNNYKKYWGFGMFYLSTYLESLQGWNCPEFEQECKNLTYAFTEFTSLMYMRFCDHKKLQETCFKKLEQVVSSQSGVDATSWREAVKLMSVDKLSQNEIIDPCIEIGMYESDSGGIGHYHEVIEPILPFCSFVWCGFDENLVKKRDISTWTCMPQNCKASIVAIMVLCGFFAVAVIICNTIVLSVLLFGRNIRNGQNVYRLSLASADILVGIVVFPTFISTLWKYIIMRHDLGKLVNVTGQEIGNGSTSHDLTTVEMRLHSGLFSSRFSPAYLNAVGFFTVLSLFVSIFTLVAAGFDRFIAVHRPLKYRQDVAAKTASVVTLAIWMFGLIFATLPWYVTNIRYGIVSSILVSAGGPTIVVLYIIAFVIPLIAMWSVTIATYVATKRLASECSRLDDADRHRREAINEMKLAATLGVMVGVFTLCLFPSVVILILGFVLVDIYYVDPSNLNQQAATSFVSSEVIVIILLMSNSLWNCFIYSIRDTEFRSSTRFIFSKLAHVMRLDKLWGSIGGRSLLETQRHESRPISEEISAHSHVSEMGANGYDNIAKDIGTTLV